MSKQQDEGGGLGCLVIVAALGLMIAGGIYFAYVRSIDFPSSEAIRQLTGAAVELYRDSGYHD